MAIDTSALQQALGPNVGVQVLAECPSTNTALLNACRDGLAQPQLLVAEVQTAGRGRLGRQWHSWPGASLTFSLAWPWDGATLDGLSLAVGCALAQALDPAGEAIRLKWPNDLLLGGAKLGGILIETVTQGAAAQAVVVGVGLNVKVPAVSPGQPATGLQALDPRFTPSLGAATLAAAPPRPAPPRPAPRWA
jgi:BirA family transcriptional regulator, biotin operon repressor / biotin---[acetyl-CoA-carboxylase] ligase